MRKPFPACIMAILLFTVLFYACADTASIAAGIPAAVRIVMPSGGESLKTESLTSLANSPADTPDAPLPSNRPSTAPVQTIPAAASPELLAEPSSTPEAAAAPSAASGRTPEPSSPLTKDGKKKVAYLTFDDGPAPVEPQSTRGTKNLLDILKKQHVKATFFLLGRCVEEYPEVAKRIVREGHAVGNHTWSHVNPESVKGREFALQVQSTSDEIFKVTGVRPKLFRPPYGGELDNTQEKLIQRLGMRVFRWNVDTRDWDGASKKAILARVEQGIRAKKHELIILFHDHSFNALDETIDLLEKNGYVFDTLDQMK